MRLQSRWFLPACAAALALVMPIAAFAQAFPSKPVRVIVPFPAGGVADLRARFFAQKISESLGQPMIVENKPGASGAIGAETVAKSAADGYTLLWGTINELAVAPAMGGPLVYNAQMDFIPIALATSGYPALVATPGLAANSVEELVALVKGKPGQINFASSGSATHQHFMAGYLARQLGLKVTLVPYKGSVSAFTDLMNGQVQLIIGYALEFAPYAKAGRLKPLAVLGPRRLPLLPDVKTMAEAGYPGFEVYGWQGFLAPAGTPPEVIRRLNAEIVKAGSSPELQKSLADSGGEFIATTPAEFGEFYRGEIAKWARIVKDSGVKVE